MPKGDFFEKLRRNKILGLAYRGYKKSVDEQTKEDLINLSDSLSQKFSQTSKLGKLDKALISLLSASRTTHAPQSTFFSFIAFSQIF